MAGVAGATDMGLSIGKLVARGSSAERRAAKSEFSGLVHRVRQANLLDHRPRAYAVKAVLIIVGIAATAVAVIGSTTRGGRYCWHPSPLCCPLRPGSSATMQAISRSQRRRRWTVASG
jgi:hypothetical protein